MPLEIRGTHFLIRSAQLVRETRLEQALPSPREFNKEAWGIPTVPSEK